MTDETDKKIINKYKEQIHYRTYYYDCLPFEDKMTHPLTKKNIIYRNTLLFKERTEIIEMLKNSRKIAMRLGFLSTQKRWQISPRKTQEIFKKLQKGESITKEDFEEEDIKPDLQQKGIDIKIGVDIATITYKRLANKIVLIAGDSDFYPAAKQARLEGVDFILDPMDAKIKTDLNEHLDGVISFLQNKKDLL